MTYKEQRTALLVYLHMKVETEDWHAVADAAMDLREMEAQWRPVTIAMEGQGGGGGKKASK